MSDANLQPRTDLFLEVFGTTRFLWSTEFKKKYLQHLRTTIESRKPSDLPDSILREEPDVIHAQVQLYDPKLEIFAQYYSQFENTGAKLVEFFKIKKYSNTEIATILKKIKDKAYSLDIHEKLTPISITRDGNFLEIIFSRSSMRVTTIKIERESLNEDIWQAIQKATRNQLRVNGHLLDVNAKTIAQRRAILRVKIDFAKQYLEVASDNFETTEDGKRKSMSQVITERKEVIKEVDKLITLPDAVKLETIIGEKKNKLITAAIMNELQKVNSPDLLVIHTRQSFHSKDEDISEIDENITSDLNNQKIGPILDKAEKEYDTYGTLKGFFNHHKEHDSDRAKYIKLLKHDGKASMESYRAFAVIVRDLKSVEKPSKLDNYMKGKSIDYIIFSYNYDEDFLEIKNSNYSPEDFNVIVSKILELSSKSSRKRS